MSVRNPHRFEQIPIFFQIIKWSAIAAMIGILAGTATAGFLASLEWVTDWRESHLWIIGFLPLVGFGMGWIYHRFGQGTGAGNDLLIDEIHDPKNVIPFRMSPLIFLATIATHLFGGSAGREGTAVQMGGSLADQLTRPLRLNNGDRRILLMAGISAGVASVFGTPLAGAIFGLEVLAMGRLRYDAIFPCLAAAIIAERVTVAWGIHRTLYQIPFIPGVSIMGMISAVIAGAAFGIVGMLFANATHGVHRTFERLVSYPPLRPCIGGILVALSVWAIGTTKYIGLGIPTIKQAFAVPVHPWDFAGKFVFTSLTLGSGFKGGEVTPLFFIGETLGNALSYILSLPTPLLAGMGFVAVFAGAANTPIASTIMGIELFGSHIGIYVGIACVVSYLFSGHAGIYRAQRIGTSKHEGFAAHEGLRLKDIKHAKRQ